MLKYLIESSAADFRLEERLVSSWSECMRKALMKTTNTNDWVLSLQPQLYFNSASCLGYS